MAIVSLNIYLSRCRSTMLSYVSRIMSRGKNNESFPSNNFVKT